MAAQVVHPPPAQAALLLVPAQVDGGLYVEVVFVVVAAQLHVELAAAGEEAAVHVAEGLGAQGEVHGVDAPLLLPALPVGEAHPAVLALGEGVLALQGELDRGGLLVLDHQHLDLKLLAGGDGGGEGEDQDELVALVEDGHVLPAGGLQQALVGGGLGGEEEAEALPGQVVLPLGAHLGAGGVDRLHVLLVVGQAQVGVLLAGQGLLALQHLELAEEGLGEDDLPALVVQRHAALDHQGGLVAGGDPQAAHHAGAVDQPVEKFPLGAVVALLHLEVPDGEQLAVEIPVALKGEKVGVIHGWLLRSWCHSGWWPARPAPPARSRRCGR